VLPAAAAPRAAPEARWTLLVQLPPTSRVEVERASGSMRGSAAALLPRLRQAGLGAVRRLAAGTVAIESRRVREIALAGRMLVLTVGVPARRRVRAVSTNRMPLSESPGHLTLLNLQLVAEGELLARAPFAVVDEPGRTAVLFQ
jgi:hypothetical protein